MHWWTERASLVGFQALAAAGPPCTHPSVRSAAGRRHQAQQLGMRW